MFLFVLHDFVSWSLLQLSRIWSRAGPPQALGARDAFWSIFGPILSIFEQPESYKKNMFLDVRPKHNKSENHSTHARSRFDSWSIPFDLESQLSIDFRKNWKAPSRWQLRTFNGFRHPKSSDFVCCFSSVIMFCQSPPKRALLEVQSARLEATGRFREHSWFGGIPETNLGTTFFAQGVAARPVLRTSLHDTD